jgi:uncharacterized protein YjbI with pentapeptide repeats
LLASLLIFASMSGFAQTPAVTQAPAEDCERPVERTLETWRKCKRLRFLAFSGLELKSPQEDQLTCYRCTFRQLQLGAAKVNLGIRESRIINGRFQNANFSGIFGAGVRARGIRAKDSTFEKADWNSAYFAEGRFENVSFRDANLKGTDFSGAVFDGVDLRGADLRQALLTRARFKNVKTDEQTKFPEGFHWAR